MMATILGRKARLEQDPAAGNRWHDRRSAAAMRACSTVPDAPRRRIIDVHVYADEIFEAGIRHRQANQRKKGF
jgi:hypothetical protein